MAQERGEANLINKIKQQIEGVVNNVDLSSENEVAILELMQTDLNQIDDKVHGKEISDIKKIIELRLGRISIIKALTDKETRGNKRSLLKELEKNLSNQQEVLSRLAIDPGSVLEEERSKCSEKIERIKAKIVSSRQVQEIEEAEVDMVVEEEADMDKTEAKVVVGMVKQYESHAQVDGVSGRSMKERLSYIHEVFEEYTIVGMDQMLNYRIENDNLQRLVEQKSSRIIRIEDGEKLERANTGFNFIFRR